MSRSGNYYARNRRDPKSRQPARPPPTPAQTTTKTRTKTAPPHPGPFDAWANRLLANGSDITTARAPHTVVRWPTTRPGTGAGKNR